MTYSATKIEVTTANGLGGDTFTRDVMEAWTHICTDRRTTDRLWYEINIPKKLKLKLKLLVQPGDSDQHGHGLNR